MHLDFLIMLEFLENIINSNSWRIRQEKEVYNEVEIKGFGYEIYNVDSYAIFEAGMLSLVVVTGSFSFNKITL